ncbi:radical SAM superfamily enzyme YgiQ (UPF0313 family) [Desulfitispora alkaliphila]|uniref:B12-binding domain-containing radical SAM protein n=1 Tax=Desulfitispora alkaliphila TaxID=622674 RepID=UPI003D22BDF5
MRYEGTVYRPPSEANSYLLQVTYGCAHNQCTFCNMYQDKKFFVRKLEEVKADIKMAQKKLNSVTKVFLCDGDAMALKTEYLLEVIGELKRAFPKLKQISCYAGPKSSLRKTNSELEALRETGLTRAYLGLETGDEHLLKEIKKGVTKDEMLQAGQKLVSAGFKLCLMAILGLAGKGPRSEQHAVATAQMVNQIKPKQFAILTLMPFPGTEIYEKVQQGQFQQLDNFEVLEEMKLLLEHITIDKLIFNSTHPSNYLPLTGTLQKDKKELLNYIEEVLSTRTTNKGIRKLNSL